MLGPDVSPQDTVDWLVSRGGQRHDDD
jgi:hypothetical protein